MVIFSTWQATIKPASLSHKIQSLSKYAVTFFSLTSQLFFQKSCHVNFVLQVKLQVSCNIFDQAYLARGTFCNATFL